MKIRIPVGLTGKEHPGPGQEFARSSHYNKFFRFAAAHQAFIEGMQRVVAMDGTECAHVEQATQGGVTHFGDGRASAHTAPTFMGLRVETDKSSEPLDGALTSSERLPTMQLHQEGQHDFGADARQGQEPLDVLVKVGMLALVASNRSIDLLHSILGNFA